MVYYCLYFELQMYGWAPNFLALIGPLRILIQPWDKPND